MLTSIRLRGDDVGNATGKSIRAVEGAVVPTFTVIHCASLPLICTDELDKLQVGPSVATGVTARLRFTVPPNFPEAVRLSVKLAVCPAVMICDVGDPDAKKSDVVLKKMPVPATNPGRTFGFFSRTYS